MTVMRERQDVVVLFFEHTYSQKQARAVDFDRTRSKESAIKDVGFLRASLGAWLFTVVLASSTAFGASGVMTIHG